MYSFIEKDGKVYINGVNNNFDEKNLLLDDLNIDSKKFE